MNPRQRGPVRMPRPMVAAPVAAQPAPQVPAVAAPPAVVDSPAASDIDQSVVQEAAATPSASQAAAAPEPVQTTAPVQAAPPPAPARAAPMSNATAGAMSSQQVADTLARLNAMVRANTPAPPPTMHVRGRPQGRPHAPAPMPAQSAQQAPTAPAGQLQWELSLPTFTQLGMTPVGWLSSSEGTRVGKLMQRVATAEVPRVYALLTERAIVEVRSRMPVPAPAFVAVVACSPYAYAPQPLYAPLVRYAPAGQVAPVGQEVAPVGQQVANGAAGLAIGALAVAALLFVAIETSK